MRVVGVPDVRVVEAVDVRPELATIHVDAGDEVLRALLRVYLEQEEGRVPFLAELVAVLDAEPDDLALSQAESVEVAERAEHLGELGILPHLHDLDRLGLRRAGRLVRLPVLEVAVEVASEDLLRPGHRLRAVRLADHHVSLEGEGNEDRADDRAGDGLRLGGRIFRGGYLAHAGEQDFLDPLAVPRPLVQEIRSELVGRERSCAADSADILGNLSRGRGGSMDFHSGSSFWLTLYHAPCVALGKTCVYNPHDTNF